MRKEIYKQPEVEIVILVVTDIVTTSDPFVDDIDWDL